MAKTYLTIGTAKHNEIMEYLVKELSIPDECSRFSVHFSVDNLVTVDCTFAPMVEESPKNG